MIVGQGKRWCIKWVTWPLLIRNDLMRKTTLQTGEGGQSQQTDVGQQGNLKTRVIYLSPFHCNQPPFHLKMHVIIPFLVIDNNFCFDSSYWSHFVGLKLNTLWNYVTENDIFTRSFLDVILFLNPFS